MSSEDFLGMLNKIDDLFEKSCSMSDMLMSENNKIKFIEILRRGNNKLNDKQDVLEKLIKRIEELQDD